MNTEPAGDQPASTSLTVFPEYLPLVNGSTAQLLKAIAALMV